jgi:hypothetical protein
MAVKIRDEPLGFGKTCHPRRLIQMPRLEPSARR